MLPTIIKRTLSYFLCPTVSFSGELLCPHLRKSLIIRPPTLLHGFDFAIVFAPDKKSYNLHFFHLVLVYESLHVLTLAKSLIQLPRHVRHLTTPYDNFTSLKKNGIKLLRKQNSTTRYFSCKRVAKCDNRMYGKKKLMQSEAWKRWIGWGGVNGKRVIHGISHSGFSPPLIFNQYALKKLAVLLRLLPEFLRLLPEFERVLRRAKKPTVMTSNAPTATNIFVVVLLLVFVSLTSLNPEHLFRVSQ